MSKRFMGSHAKALVAVTFDERSNSVTKVAKQLGERTGLTLRFSHVVEPILSTFAPQLLGVDSPIYDLTHESDIERVKEARAHLHELALSLQNGAIIEEHVAIGPITSTLMADAFSSGSTLFLCGATNESYRFLPSGFSTALGLMEQAQLPVLVVPAAVQLDLSKIRLRIVIADDLSQQCYDAVLQGLDFARALGNTDVVHLHIDATDYKSIERYSELWRQSSDNRGQQALEWLSNSQNIIDQILTNRAPERMPLLTGRNCTYKTMIKKIRPSRKVLDSVTEVVEELDPDILVFGRHQRVHWRPFALGRLPFHALLQQKRAIMVVPPGV